MLYFEVRTNTKNNSTNSKNVMNCRQIDVNLVDIKTGERTPVYGIRTVTLNNLGPDSVPTITMEFYANSINLKTVGVIEDV